LLFPPPPFDVVHRTVPPSSFFSMSDSSACDNELRCPSFSLLGTAARQPRAFSPFLFPPPPAPTYTNGRHIYDPLSFFPSPTAGTAPEGSSTTRAPPSSPFLFAVELEKIVKKSFPSPRRTLRHRRRNWPTDFFPPSSPLFPPPSRVEEKKREILFFPFFPRTVVIGRGWRPSPFSHLDVEEERGQEEWISCLSLTQGGRAMAAPTPPPPSLLPPSALLEEFSTELRTREGPNWRLEVGSFLSFFCCVFAEARRAGTAEEPTFPPLPSPFFIRAENQTGRGARLFPPFSFSRAGSREEEGELKSGPRQLALPRYRRTLLQRRPGRCVPPPLFPPLPFLTASGRWAEERVNVEQTEWGIPPTFSLPPHSTSVT